MPLNTNVSVLLSGEIGFSRINTQYTSAEIMANNQKKASQGHQAFSDDPNKPFTQLALSNPKIIPADPAGLNPEEQAVQSKIKNNKAEYAPTLWVRNKTRNLPAIGVFNGTDEQGNQIVEQFDLEGELDSGVPVTIVVHAFEHLGNVGINLDTVIIASKEAVKYYSGVSNDALNAHRIVLSGGLTSRPAPDATQAPQGAPQGVPQMPMPGSGQPLPTGLPGMGGTYTQPQPQMAPAPQMPAAPTTPQPQMAPVPQMADFAATPAAPQQPATNLPPHQQGSPFQASPVQQENLPASPFAGQQQVEQPAQTSQPGIGYDPNGGSPWPSSN